MSKVLATSCWRTLRWAACAAVIPFLWACNSHALVAPPSEPRQTRQDRFKQSINRDLDILFMIDNSNSMKLLQTKMIAQFPAFMNKLKNLPTGQPNLHVAVITSSLGAGMFSNVRGCEENSVSGNQGGKFQHPSSCTALPAGQTYLSSIKGPNGGALVTNFGDNDIADVFSCIANVGDAGCGFEHQFGSTMVALQKASTANDPDNGGFLRPGAYLAIVMLTNEDDCSAPPRSRLFDPSSEALGDQLGGLTSYRCNEYGHLCGPNHAPPQHLPPAAGMIVGPLDCTSAEGVSPSPPADADHQLITVKSFVEFLKALKPDEPNKILVAAIAGPPTPYNIVQTTTRFADDRPPEVQPLIAHSCVQASGEYGDPSVRIVDWLAAFGGHLYPICANDFSIAMNAIGDAIGRRLGAQCIAGTVETKADRTPDCDVALRTFDANTKQAKVPDTMIPFCMGSAPHLTNASPACWHFVPDAACVPEGQVPSQRLEVCYDKGCTPEARPTDQIDAVVSCSICPSGTMDPATNMICP